MEPTLNENLIDEEKSNGLSSSINAEGRKSYEIPSTDHFSFNPPFSQQKNEGVRFGQSIDCSNKSGEEESNHFPDNQQLDMLRQKSIHQRGRLSIYQQVKEKLNGVKDVNWENDIKERSVIVGEEQLQHPNNLIKTSRYNIVSFLPLNMYEQFSKVSNIYFLLTGLLQMIPAISNSGEIPTVYLPLIFIVFVAALKDVLEDLNRHASDKEENHTMTRKAVLCSASSRESSRLSLGGGGRFQDIFSQELRVGCIIKIRQNEPIPADSILLRSSEQKGGCFVETKNLDGETNLKPKFISKDVLSDIYPNDISLSQKKVRLNYEGPNPLLYKFNGNIEVLDEIEGKSKIKVSLDEKNILLRGCILRNTRWVYCVVIYTGHETKIMLNAHTPDIKQSSVEKKMSVYIIVVCVLQITFCILSAVYYVIWYNIMENQIPYLFIESSDCEDTPLLNLVISSGIWLMALLNFVPIALLVTLEMVRFMQAIVISKEKLMKSFNGFPPTVQSSNLNEDLGQIQCIFSDKTGTLTCNIMNFKCLFVNGNSYGAFQDQSSKQPKNEPSNIEQKKKNLERIPNVNFVDPYFVSLLDNQEKSNQTEDIQKALLHLSICHSVILSEKDNQVEESNQQSKVINDGINKKLTNESENNETLQDEKQYEYQAASPDDLALVNFAKYAGYEYQGSDAEEIITILKHSKRYYGSGGESEINQNTQSQTDQKLKFQVLHVIEFTSDRKRMSIIFRDLQTNTLQMYTKGADSVILKRVNQQYYTQNNEGIQLVEQLQSNLDEYAKIGLRTLLLASKELSEEEFTIWDLQYKQAQSSLVNREQKMSTLQDQIENNFMIVGATAIEDKLQDDVEGTIYSLKEAGILFWILTGDKKETAINIGLSTRVLEPTDIILTLDEFSASNTLLSQMEKMIEKVNLKENKINSFCLVVTGEMLTCILDNRDLSNKLIKIGAKCKSVIACRVSPKQKKDIVTIYRQSEEGKGKRTLAIGDGANDVNMITEAHVGVGIKGLEGMQAARSSDYAIGEFKILRRLILFHGRECYRRNSVVILYNLYKNAMYLSPLLYFGFNSGFSGSNLYDIYIFQMYNAMFTAFPIILYAVLDRNLSSKILVKSPHLYKTGIEGVFLNRQELCLWIFQGFSHAAIIYYFAMYSLDSQIDVYHVADLTQIGQVMFMLTVFVANFKVIIHTNTGYSMGIIIQILSFAVYFSLEIFSNFYLEYDLYNILSRIFISPCSYLVFFLSLLATIMFDYGLIVYKDFIYFMKLAEDFKERKQIPDKSLRILYDENANVYDIRKTLKIDFNEDQDHELNQSFDEGSQDILSNLQNQHFELNKNKNISFPQNITQNNPESL